MKRLGRFEIQAQIGSGAFGDVYRAFDPAVNSIVAIKTLKAHGDATAFARFKGEAAAARKLVHPNIVTIFDFGQEGAEPYLVMEYLDGEDLQHIIDSHTPLSLYQKIRIMVQVADGLHCAHRNGVVHRDVKPANIMVLKDGSVKIMDFGIARLMRDTSTRLTQQGALVGTVLYMAPELFSDSTFGQVDALCDIWSYGVILYELLAGKNPFATGAIQAEIFRIVTLDIPLLPPNVYSPELQSIVSKLLSRQREKRYRTLEDARFGLLPLLKNFEAAEVERLLSGAQKFVDARQWNEALEVARDALRVDPSHRIARAIFDLAETNLQEVALRKSTDDLIARATDLESAGKIAEAIDLIDSASQHDRDDERVRALLQDLHTRKRNRAEASKLVMDAGKEFREKRLPAAFDLITRAIELDDTTEARQLRDQIQAEIQRLEDDQAYRAELRRADGLEKFGDLDGALTLLTAMQTRFPGRSLTDERIARVKGLIDERTRWQFYSRLRARIKDLVGAHDFDKAIQELQSVPAELRDEEAIRELLESVTRERDEWHRTEEIQRIAAAAKEHHDARRYSDAIPLLEKGLEKYPLDPGLTRLLRVIHDEQRKFERERALQDALDRCRDSFNSEHYDELLDFYAELPPEIQMNRELRALVGEARQKRDNTQTSIRTEVAVDQAKKSLKEGRLAEARRTVETAVASVGQRPELTRLLQEITQAEFIESERKRIEQVVKDAQWLESQGEIATALKIVSEELVRSPESTELKAEKARLEAKDAEAARIAGHETAIRDAIRRKAWKEADTRLAEASKIYPGALTRLGEELRRRKEEYVEQLVGEARRFLDDGKVAEAEQFLRDHLLGYRDTPAVMALTADCSAAKQQKAFVEERLRAARGLEQRDPAGALDILRAALEKYPAEPNLLDAHQRVSALVPAANYRALLTSIDNCLDRSDWEQALRVIEQAASENPNDSALIPRRTRAIDQRRSFLESAAASVRSLVADRKLDDARTFFTKTLARHADQAVTRDVERELSGAEEKRTAIDGTLKSAAAAGQQGNFARARSVLAGGLEKYPGDAELQAALDRLGMDDRKRGWVARQDLIQKDLDSRNWQAALTHIEEARGGFPESSQQLEAFSRQAIQLRDREVRPSVDKALACLNVDDLAGAEKILKKQLAPFAGVPIVEEVAAKLKDAKTRVTLMETASGNTRLRRYDDAEAAIRQLEELRPGDPEATRLRTALAAAREQERKEKLYKDGRTTGVKLMRERRYPEAVTLFESLLEEFPGDPVLKQDLTRAMQEAAPEVTVQPRNESAPKPPSRLPLYGGLAAAIAAIAGLVIWMLWPAGIKLDRDHLDFPPFTDQRIVVTGSNVPSPQSTAYWVTFTRGPSAGGKTEFLVHVEPDKLTPGPHSAELTFTPQAKVQLNITVPAKAEKALDVEPRQLTFIYARDGITPRTILATGPGIQPPHSSQPWLTAVPGTHAGDSVEFTVKVSAKDLSPGRNNTGELVFSNDVKVLVDVVAPSDNPIAQPAYLAFPQGGERQTVIVTGPGNISTPVPRERWVTIKSRRTSPGRAEFEVTTSTTSVDAGRKYETDLFFGPQTRVHVVLTVAPKPTPNPGNTSGNPPGNPPNPSQPLELSTTDLKFIFDRVHPPASQTIHVTGSEIPEPTKTAAWLTLTPKKGANSVDYTVQVSADGLRPGPQTDEVTFTPQKKVHISFEVYDPPQLSAPPDQDITWTGTLPAGESLTIKARSAGSGRVDFALPTYNGKVSVTNNAEAIAIDQQPSQANNYRLVVRNKSASVVRMFAVKWEKQP